MALYPKKVGVLSETKNFKIFLLGKKLEKEQKWPSPAKKQKGRRSKAMKNWRKKIAFSSFFPIPDWWAALPTDESDD